MSNEKKTGTGLGRFFCSPAASAANNAKKREEAKATSVSPYGNIPRDDSRRHRTVDAAGTAEMDMPSDEAFRKAQEELKNAAYVCDPKADVVKPKSKETETAKAPAADSSLVDQIKEACDEVKAKKSAVKFEATAEAEPIVETKPAEAEAKAEAKKPETKPAAKAEPAKAAEAQEAPTEPQVDRDFTLSEACGPDIGIFVTFDEDFEAANHLEEGMMYSVDEARDVLNASEDIMAEVPAEDANDFFRKDAYPCRADCYWISTTKVTETVESKGDFFMEGGGVKIPVSHEEEAATLMQPALSNLILDIYIAHVHDNPDELLDAWIRNVPQKVKEQIMLATFPEMDDLVKYGESEKLDEQHLYIEGRRILDLKRHYEEIIQSRKKVLNFDALFKEWVQITPTVVATGIISLAKIEGIVVGAPSTPRQILHAIQALIRGYRLTAMTGDAASLYAAYEDNMPYEVKRILLEEAGKLAVPRPEKTVKLRPRDDAEEPAKAETEAAETVRAEPTEAKPTEAEEPVAGVVKPAVPVVPVAMSWPDASEAMAEPEAKPTEAKAAYQPQHAMESPTEAKSATPRRRRGSFNGRPSVRR